MKPWENSRAVETVPMVLEEMEARAVETELVVLVETVSVALVEMEVQAAETAQVEPVAVLATPVEEIPTDQCQGKIHTGHRPPRIQEG